MATTSATTAVGRGHSVRLAPSHAVGGIGGLVFVATVIVQNAIRGLAAPSAGAATASVTHFYATNWTSALVLAALFPVGAAGLAGFVGALVPRLLGSTRPATLAGFLGAAGIFATYTMVVGTDIALAGYVHRGSPNAGIVSALWILHNTVFGCLLVSIAVALAGFTAAAAASGMVRSAWKPLGALGALALAVTGAATPALIDGSGIIGLGLLGFIAWVAFVTTTAINLLRHPAGHGPVPEGQVVGGRFEGGMP